MFVMKKVSMNYKVVRSGRKTMALEMSMEGLIVRAPMRISEAAIDQFVHQHKDWIEKKQRKVAEKKKALEALEPLTIDEIRALANEAMKVIPERVKFYAPKIGVDYGRITIRNQRSKWGSCSAKGNLNFNCLLMLTPPEVLDSVVVHELCHRKEMNHSDRFYAEVLRVFPDYHTWHRWLKDNGDLIMKRMK